MPLCTKCGAPLPVEDEAQLIRETVGASYDFKWVVVGGVIILVLQAITIVVIWQIAGKKFLTGPPRRSLLEASVESVEPNYGQYESSEEVKITIKLDKNKVNTADTVQEVRFGEQAAKPYLEEKLARVQKECGKRCADGKKAPVEKKKCDALCRKAKEALKASKQCARVCNTKCGGVCTDEKLLALEEADRTLCQQCPKKRVEATKLDEQCEICDKRVKYLEYQQKQCKLCDTKLANLRKDLKKCKKDGTGCFSVTAYDKRKELKEKKAHKPKRREDEKAKLYKRRLKSWKSEVQRLERDLISAEDLSVYAFVPPSNEPKTVPVQLQFASGYKVSKRPGYHYVENPSSGKPTVEKKKRRRSSTGHVGFWIMLGISMIIYFFGGMFTGRLSPGITMKEPATAGFFSGVLYFMFLLLIGADFAVVMFSFIVGVPAFAGAAFVGGWAGEKWQGTI
jgi:hypothetical protein